MKTRIREIIAVALIAACLGGAVVYASTGDRNITVTYRNIKVYKDNVLCELKDANGKVIEPFIYNGTTYLPVRGTANIAGMDVTWEGSTSSVYLWDEVKPAGTALMDVCPPYALNPSWDTKAHYQAKGESFEMSGKKYSNGITGKITGGYALFNLDSKYSSVECVVGHYGDQEANLTVQFFVDDRLVKEVTLEPHCLPKTVSIPVSYGLQLKINVPDQRAGISTYNAFGIGNITVQ